MIRVTCRSTTSHGERMFGARNLFRLKAGIIQPCRSLQETVSIREVKRTEVRAPLVVSPPRWEVCGLRSGLLWSSLLITAMSACATASAQQQQDLKGISTNGPRYSEIAESTSPTLNPAELDRRLAEMETRMKKSLDSYRLPSEYRKLCDGHGQYDRAINFFCDLVAAQPDNWRAHLELSCAYVDKIPTRKGALAMVNQGALAGKALDQADTVVATKPDLWVSYYARGLNHLNWPRAFHHSEDAIKDLMKCVKIQERQGGQGG